MSKFSIEQISKDSVEIIRIKGSLDAHTAPDLESAIASIVEGGKNNIVVSFQELEYISSAGLGVFMVFFEDIREGGGDIKLAAMKQKVFSVFDLLGFPTLFDIVESEDEAISKFLSN
jgi:anti-sigma B factor antagonist